jgi:chorismate-pyruvate lyase
MRHPLHAERAEIDGGAAALAAHLDAAPSVTVGLLSWCEARGIGDGPLRVLACARAAPPDDLARLLGAAGEAAELRRVILGRGEVALAEADNLHLPGRLPEAMRRALAETDRPFGDVLAPLGLVRRTVERLAGAAAGPGVVLAQTALVLARDGTALAAVRERFLPALLRPGSARRAALGAAD